MVPLSQLTTEGIATIFLTEMKKLSQPQVSNLLALQLISWKIITICNSLQGFNYFFYALQLTDGGVKLEDFLHAQLMMDHAESSQYRKCYNVAIQHLQQEEESVHVTFILRIVMV